MAHHKSAQKRIRRNARRSDVNSARVGRIRTYLHYCEEAIALGDRDKALAALKKAEPELMRGVGRGVIRRNTAARRVSRMVRRVKAMQA
jgi:small subunit ribosomal protein S20